MRTVMAFGDSLTWGTDAANQRRHAFENRWPNVMQAELGTAVHVVAEGLGGRTTMFDHPEPHVDRNGANALPILLGSHNPLDLVIVMLGTNDLKPELCGRVSGAEKGMDRLIDLIASYPYNWNAPAPQVLIVSPPHLCTKADGNGPDGGRVIAESEKLAPAYAALAARRGVEFWDAARVAKASPADGVHLDAANTRAIGQGLAQVVRSSLKL